MVEGGTAGGICGGSGLHSVAIAALAMASRWGKSRERLSAESSSECLTCSWENTPRNVMQNFKKTRHLLLCSSWSMHLHLCLYHAMSIQTHDAVVCPAKWPGG